MIRRRKQSVLEEATVDMAPLIDMTFLLLIFFLVNTNFIKETGIEVKRPEAATGQAKTGDLILVGISSAGTVHMNGKRIDIGSLRSNVAQMVTKAKAPVIVVADEGARAGLIVAVIDECKLAGAEDISLATQSEGGA